MLLNYLKMTVRFLRKNPTFSGITIFGLTVGFASFLVITLYLHEELHFDNFHRDGSRIYRIVQHEKLENGTTRDVVTVASRFGPEVVKQLPEVHSSVRVVRMGRLTLGNDPANRFYERIVTADSNFFSFFDYPLVEGDAKTALIPPDAIVVSETIARKYFGDESPLGKRIWSVLKRNDKPVELTITGVMKDFPKNSHMQIDILFSDATWPSIFDWYREFTNTDWVSNSFTTYVKMHHDLPSTRTVEDKITSMAKANYPTDKDFSSSFSLQPLRDIHLHSGNFQGTEGETPSFKMFYVYMFGAIAFMILLIACLNYMNLSTAAAYRRTREIGTRKTLGAQRRQLVFQFTGEAILLSMISMIIAVAMVQVALPFINNFTEKDMSMSQLPASWALALLGTMILTGVLASLYPAFIIARVVPAEALKRDLKIGRGSIPVRKLLVAAQFAIAVIMITSTLVIYNQLNFLRNKELGFDHENLVVIDINSTILRRDAEIIKEKFAGLPEVQSVTTSTRVPGEWKLFPIATVKSESQSEGEAIWVGIDESFLDTYKLELVEGRNFLPGNADSTKVILTELAVKELGLSNPVGKWIEIPRTRRGGSIEDLEAPFRVEVIGVVKDFHFESFRSRMMPLIFGAGTTVIQPIDYYTLRISTTNWPETIERLKALNATIDADNPLEYNFLDSKFQEFYSADEKRASVFMVFSVIVVLIACLGLFALVSYSIESRIKEIGIRKVLGASVQNIVGIISKEYLLLVLGGAMLAVPVSWYFMDQWLQEFAYNTGVPAGVYVLAILLALVIAFATISVRTIKAAIVNPVKTLRTE